MAAFVIYISQMLIKSYGEYWSREGVDWLKKTLPGKRRFARAKGFTVQCDAWHQSGIYALYDHFKIVYVGQADNNRMGARLLEHTRDRFARRWDSFSWFGLAAYDAAGKALRYEAIPIEASSAIRSLELLGIILSDAPLNRSRGKFEGAEKIVQKIFKVKGDDQKVVEQALKKLGIQLDRIAERI